MHLRVIASFIVLFSVISSLAHSNTPCESLIEQGDLNPLGTFDSMKIDFSTGKLTASQRIPDTLILDQQVVPARVVIQSNPNSDGFIAKWVEPSDTFISTQRKFGIGTAPVIFEAELSPEFKILKLKARPSGLSGLKGVSHLEFSQGNIMVTVSLRPYEQKLSPFEIMLPEKFYQRMQYGELTFTYDQQGSLVNIDHSAIGFHHMISNGEPNPQVYKNISTISVHRTPKKVVIVGVEPEADNMFLAMSSILSTARKIFEAPGPITSPEVSANSKFERMMTKRHKEVEAFLALSYGEQLSFIFGKSSDEMEFWEFIRMTAEAQDYQPAPLAEIEIGSEVEIDDAVLKNSQGIMNVMGNLDKIGEIATHKQQMATGLYGTKWKMDVRLGKDFDTQRDIPFLKLERQTSLRSDTTEQAIRGVILNTSQFFYGGTEEGNPNIFLVRAITQKFNKINIEIGEATVSAPKIVWLRFYHDPNWSHEKYLTLLSVMKDSEPTWIETHDEMTKVLREDGALYYFLEGLYGPYRPAVCWMDLRAHDVSGFNLRSIYLGSIFESLFSNQGRLDNFDLEALRHVYRHPKEEE